MAYLTVAWEAPYNIGLMPQDPGEIFSTVLTVGWNAKQGTYVLPFDTADLTVKPAPGAPAPTEPVVVNPTDSPAPAPAGSVGAGPVPPAPAPAPAAVRPAQAPRVVTLARVTPQSYRARGVRVRITLPEKARVVVHLEARMKKRGSRRRATTSLRRLTKQRAVTLKPGTTTLRLTPTIGGRQVIRNGSRTRASLLVSVRYADGRRSTARRTVTLAAAPKAAKK